MKKNTKYGTLAAIMSAYFIFMGLGNVSPAIQGLIAAFPDVPRTMVLQVTSLPSLFVIIASFVTGKIAGTKISYKSLLLISSGITVAAGVLPYFLNNFTAILVSRAVLGLAFGTLFPLCSASVVSYVKESQRAKVMGIGTFFQNGGSIAAKIIAGYLCAVSWRLTFLTYLFGLITFILVLFFLPNIPPSGRETATRAESKTKLPKGVIFYAVFWGLGSLFCFPLFMNISSVVILEELGDAGAAGISISINTAGGLIAGLIFSYCLKVFRKQLFTVGSIAAGIGTLIVFFGSNMGMVNIGMFLAGVGNGLLWPTIPYEMGKFVSPDVFPRASGLMMILQNLMSVISPYFISLVSIITGNDSPRTVIGVCGAGFIIIGLAYAILQAASFAPQPAES